MQTFFFRILSIFIISLLVMGCVAKNLNEGSRSFRMQNYRDAFIRLKPEAKRGQPDAQYAVGYMYYYGQGVVEDRKKAWYWISKAARSGQPDAVAALDILEKVA
ncbi:MAG: sel1 repeat family protein [Legionella sp.]|nr:sel1 repeat family protein [Legionella sp.]